MRFKNLDLNLLVALDVLLAEESVSRAAEKINLSQSAMSAALQRLRDYFGDELFVTIGRKTRPTPLALELAEPVRRVLNAVSSEIISREPFDPASSERSFRLAASDYFTRVALTRFIPMLQRIAPGVRVDIWPVTGSNTLASFSRGDIDFMISVSSVLLPNLPVRTLWSEDFVCIAWTGNTELGDVLTREDFARMGHVAVRLGTLRATPIDESIVSKAGIQRRIEVIAGAFDLIPELIVGTTRIAMLQRQLADHYRKVIPIRVYELPWQVTPFEVAIQWHKHGDSDPANLWFRKTLFDWVATQ